MAKKNAELHVAFCEGSNASHSVSVILHGLDLYTITHFTPLAGKHSYHASGVSHATLELVGRRISGGRAPSIPLGHVKRYKWVTGFGAGWAPELGDYVIKPDGTRRRTLAVPRPKYPWGIDVWGIEPDRLALAQKIAATKPWPESVVLGSVLADWTKPWLLVTLWAGTHRSPYEVIKYSPPIPKRVPYIIYPEKYKGTWMEGVHGKLHPLEQRILEHALAGRDRP